MTADLFSEQTETQVKFAEGALWLRGFAMPEADVLCDTLIHHLETHPPQRMVTPMGYQMSVCTTSFGKFGWVGTTEGYGYSKLDLATQQPWPVIPKVFLGLANRAALQAGYVDFIPDTCLVNIYEAGSKMGLHQDKDEQDFSQPIVSVSLGLSATFLFGGQNRTDKTTKIPVTHGDVLVWGGGSRLHYHGVSSLNVGEHNLLGERRFNLTLRKAGKI